MKEAREKSTMASCSLRFLTFDERDTQGCQFSVSVRISVFVGFSVLIKSSKNYRRRFGRKNKQEEKKNFFGS